MVPLDTKGGFPFSVRKRNVYKFVFFFFLTKWITLFLRFKKMNGPNYLEYPKDLIYFFFLKKRRKEKGMIFFFFFLGFGFI